MEKKKTTKEKLKNSWEDLDFTIRLVRSQKKIEGAEFMLRHFEKYKKIVYFFLSVAFIYNLIRGNFELAFISFAFLHLHGMTNQNIWETRTLQSYMKQDNLKNNDTQD